MDEEKRIWKRHHQEEAIEEEEGRRSKQESLYSIILFEIIEIMRPKQQCKIKMKLFLSNQIIVLQSIQNWDSAGVNIKLQIIVEDKSERKWVPSVQVTIYPPQPSLQTVECFKLTMLKKPWRPRVRPSQFVAKMELSSPLRKSSLQNCTRNRQTAEFSASTDTLEWLDQVYTQMFVN